MNPESPSRALDEEWITLEHTELRVLRGGTGCQNLVFLHGVGARADRWRATVRSCSEAGYSTFALDFPGHGFSTKGPEQIYSAPRFAETMTLALEQLDISEATLIGTSLGGHVASLMALDRPDLVTRLVLVGPMGVVPLGAAGCEALASAVMDVSLQGVAAKLRRLVHDDTLVSQEWIKEEVAINSSPGAAEALARMADYFRTGIDQDVVGDALLRRRADLPCLLVWGAQDDLVPTALAPQVMACLPRLTRYVEIDAAAHAPYLEQPQAFATALLDFLAAP
jgi:pimeloyl-ACP methyl ester carboxylesterase